MENQPITSASGISLPLPVPSPREELRNNINALADPPAREAVLSNTLALAVVSLSGLVAGLSRAQTLAEMREAAAPFAEMADAVTDAVEKGELRFPYQLKEGGTATVSWSGQSDPSSATCSSS